MNQETVNQEANLVLARIKKNETAALKLLDGLEEARTKYEPTLIKLEKQWRICYNKVVTHREDVLLLAKGSPLSYLEKISIKESVLKDMSG